MKRAILLIILMSLAPDLSAWANVQLHHRPLYTLHIGDVIVLSYRLTPQFNQTVTVQPDGSVGLKLVGDIHVAGLTLNQLHDRIVQLASKELNHPELAITLKHFQPPYVVIAGEVEKPGKIVLHEDTTALQAIMLAGGFKPAARDTRVILFRHINGDEAEVRCLDLHKITKRAQLERDIVLEPGDMLLVTRNRLAHFSHFMKATNLGVYFDPIQKLP